MSRTLLRNAINNQWVFFFSSHLKYLLALLPVCIFTTAFAMIRQTDAQALPFPEHSMTGYPKTTAV